MAARTSVTVTPTAIVVAFTALIAFILAFTLKSMLAHLIGALTLSVLVTAIALAVVSVRKLTVTRTVPGTAFDGDSLKMEFEVRNDGRTSRRLVEVLCGYYASHVVSGRLAALAAEIPGGGSAVLTATIDDVRRGEYVFQPPTVISGDPFGLIMVARTADELEEPTLRVTVFPLTFPIDRLSILSDMSWSFTGVEPTNRPGHGGEILGTREYRWGDSVRAIHWPLSARMGELIVKEFERSASTEVTIFVDLDAKAAWGSGREQTLEYSVRIAASAADYACRRGNSVRLVAYGTQWIVVPPGKGMLHQQMLMHYLAAFQSTGQTPFNYVIGQMAPRLREGSSAVVVFPNEHLHLDLFGPALEALWSRRIRLTAILLNVESFLAGTVSQTKPDLTAAAYLSGRGATVYLVSKGDDLGRCLSVPL